MQREIYHCYIDESGCDGFKFDKGSDQWFVLAGFISKEKDVPKTKYIIDKTKAHFWRRRNWIPPETIHWHKLKEIEKQFIINCLFEKDFTLVIVTFWKSKLTKDNMLHDRNYLYRYMCKYLLERVTSYVNDRNGFLKLIFSNRKKFQKKELIDYLSKELSENSFMKNVFSPRKIIVKESWQLKMLQIADCCVSAFGDSFNPRHKNSLDPRFAHKLIVKLYKKSTKEIYGYGLKLFPNDCHEEICRQYPFVRIWVNK